MALKLYNTLGRAIAEFEPADSNETRLYTCGPTVYNHVHIGNLRAFIFSDLLKRTLQLNGFNVNWVMNITDVDDKTIHNTIQAKGAKANLDDLFEFTSAYFQSFLKDLEKINIHEEDISFVKVSEKVGDIQEYIQKLVEKGYAYQTDDGTYFDITKYQADFADYGSLVGDKFLEGKKIGARVKVDEYDKENLSDFALWKTRDESDGNIFWDHPKLGQGRPGWHIECTLINYLKFPRGTDIHTGGVDLIFPHHTNEIAQAQPLYKPFVKYWVHSEHLLVNNQKMAKSAGNYFTLRDLEQKNIADGLSLRYLMLQSHYRSKLNITEQSLRAAKSGLENLRQQIASLKNGIGSDKKRTINEQYLELFTEALNEDLNTPEALAVLHKLLDSELDPNEKLNTAFKMDEVFGLKLDETAESYLAIEDLPDEIKDLLKQRKEAKANKDYAKADQIRQALSSQGYILEDTADGIKVRKARA